MFRRVFLLAALVLLLLPASGRCLTGYALGFVDSPRIDPATGTAFQDEASELWWKSAQAFGYLQSDPTRYDQYAAYLQTVSGAYGYPFSGVWQIVQVSFDPSTVNTLEIDVLPDAAITLAISGVTRTPGTAHLTGQGAPGGSVIIQSSPDLSAGSWTTLGTVTADAAGVFSYDDTAAYGAKKFYRAVYS